MLTGAARGGCLLFEFFVLEQLHADEEGAGHGDLEAGIFRAGGGEGEVAPGDLGFQVELDVQGAGAQRRVDWIHRRVEFIKLEFRRVGFKLTKAGRNDALVPGVVLVPTRKVEGVGAGSRHVGPQGQSASFDASPAQALHGCLSRCQSPR